MNIGLYQQPIMKLAMTPQLRQAIDLLQYSTEELDDYLEQIQLDNPLLEVEKANSIVNASFDISELAACESRTLQAHLMEQLYMLEMTEKERNGVIYIIHSLDDNGYLTITTEELRDLMLLTTDEVLRMITLTQSLEPLGIAARNLQECLLLQIPDHYSLARVMIGDHFDLFVNKKWMELANLLQVPIAEISSAQTYIQQLNPRPGAGFLDQDQRYIVPDVYVKVADDKLTVVLNEAIIPRLSYSDSYSNLRNQHAYVKDNLAQIKWLEQSLGHRNRTLLDVATAICQIQESYFKHPQGTLVPMTRKDVATIANVHESTVSRISMNKYMETPRGLFELKQLFSSGLAMSKENISSLTVKDKLKQLIKNESKANPFTDDMLVNLLLSKYKIKISRRTVTKYRKAMNIPKSNHRKENV